MSIDESAMKFFWWENIAFLLVTLIFFSVEMIEETGPQLKGKLNPDDFYKLQFWSLPMQLVY